MKQHCHALIDAAARDLAGKTHEEDALRERLFALVRECMSPFARDAVPVRRMPAAGEVLPPQQRASWARARTPYDR